METSGVLAVAIVMALALFGVAVQWAFLAVASRSRPRKAPAEKSRPSAHDVTDGAHETELRRAA